MAKQQKNHFAGGLGLLAATAFLCMQGLKKVEQRLRKNKQNARTGR